MAVPSDGSYGIAAGVIYSYPVTVQDGEYRIVAGTWPSMNSAASAWTRRAPSCARSATG